MHPIQQSNRQCLPKKKIRETRRRQVRPGFSFLLEDPEIVVLGVSSTEREGRDARRLALTAVVDSKEMLFAQFPMRSDRTVPTG